MRRVVGAIDLVALEGAAGAYLQGRRGAVGDELHHFGWNACSSALCPAAPHLERRYLIVPGMRSSRIYVMDTKPDPHPQDYGAGRGDRPRRLQPPPYSPLRPGRHLYEPMGWGNGNGGPGGVFLLDHLTFDVIRRNTQYGEEIAHQLAQIVGSDHRGFLIAYWHTG